MRMSKEQYARLVALIEAIAEVKVDAEDGGFDSSYIREREAKRIFESLCVEPDYED